MNTCTKTNFKMETQIAVIQLTQQNLVKVLDSVTEEQFNKIPVGYSNNLIWNFMHVLASFQVLCYSRAGIPSRLDENFVNSYKIGTKPETHISMEQYATIKENAEWMLVKFKEDYAAGVFNSFQPYATSMGFAISSVDIALEYITMHHGLHLGYAMAIKKLVV